MSQNFSQKKTKKISEQIKNPFQGSPDDKKTKSIGIAHFINSPLQKSQTSIKNENSKINGDQEVQKEQKEQENKMESNLKVSLITEEIQNLNIQQKDEKIEEPIEEVKIEEKKIDQNSQKKNEVQHSNKQIQKNQEKSSKVDEIQNEIRIENQNYNISPINKSFIELPEDKKSKNSKQIKNLLIQLSKSIKNASQSKKKISKSKQQLSQKEKVELLQSFKEKPRMELPKKETKNKKINQ